MIVQKTYSTENFRIYKEAGGKTHCSVIEFLKTELVAMDEMKLAGLIDELIEELNALKNKTGTL